jgi:serine/threonine protein kinase
MHSSNRRRTTSQGPPRATTRPSTGKTSMAAPPAHDAQPTAADAAPNNSSMRRTTTTTTSVGGYRIGEVLGKGSFGTVRSGTHIATGQRVAIKVLEKSRLTKVADAKRVLREIRIFRRLRHPNIVTLLEVIDAPQNILLVTENVAGGSSLITLLATSA